MVMKCFGRKKMIKRFFFPCWSYLIPVLNYPSDFTSSSVYIMLHQKSKEIKLRFLSWSFLFNILLFITGVPRECQAEFAQEYFLRNITDVNTEISNTVMLV